MELLRWAEAEAAPVEVIGSGSNLLVADDGVRGLVLKLAGELTEIERDGERIVCGGGVRLPSAAAKVAGWGLGGLEFGINIPGTVGGAVRMNANAYGGQLAQRARVGRRLHPVRGPSAGTRRTSASPIAAPRLRPGEVVARAAFGLTAAEPSAVKAILAEMRAMRREAQPSGIKTFGSTFKNPEPDDPGAEGRTAGQLLAAADCAGLAVGGARFNPKHANFVENTGAATTADVLAVMAAGRRRVHERLRGRAAARGAGARGRLVARRLGARRGLNRPSFAAGARRAGRESFPDEPLPRLDRSRQATRLQGNGPHAVDQAQGGRPGELRGPGAEADGDQEQPVTLDAPRPRVPAAPRSRRAPSVPRPDHAPSGASRCPVAAPPASAGPSPVLTRCARSGRSGEARGGTASRSSRSWSRPAPPPTCSGCATPRWSRSTTSTWWASRAATATQIVGELTKVAEEHDDPARRYRAARRGGAGLPDRRRHQRRSQLPARHADRGHRASARDGRERGRRAGPGRRRRHPAARGGGRATTSTSRCSSSASCPPGGSLDGDPLDQALVLGAAPGAPAAADREDRRRRQVRHRGHPARRDPRAIRQLLRARPTNGPRPPRCSPTRSWMGSPTSTSASPSAPRPAAPRRRPAEPSPPAQVEALGSMSTFDSGSRVLRMHDSMPDPGAEIDTSATMPYRRADV